MTSLVPRCGRASLAATAPMEPGGCGRTLLPKAMNSGTVMAGRDGLTNMTFVKRITPATGSMS